MAVSARQLIPSLESAFRKAGIPTPRADAEWLVAGVLGVGRTETYLAEEPLSAETVQHVERLAARRLDGEPVPYLLGSADFFGRRLKVNAAVLVPRPETEVLVGGALERLRSMAGADNPLRILELGTGSGAVAITLAAEISACQITAVELSWNALAVAKDNIARHRLQGRIQLVHADWTAGVRGPFDLVIANPPYVTTEEVGHLASPRYHEPRLSLDGGADGMRLSRRLWADAPRLTRPGGWIGVECAEAHAAVLRKELSGVPWVRAAMVFHDLTGRPRGLWVEAWPLTS